MKRRLREGLEILSMRGKKKPGRLWWSQCHTKRLLSYYVFNCMFKMFLFTMLCNEIVFPINKISWILYYVAICAICCNKDHNVVN